MHATDARFSLNVFAAQISQPVPFSMTPKPGTHTHAVANIAPVSAVLVFSGHASHVCCPADALKNPVAHGTQPGPVALGSKPRSQTQSSDALAAGDSVVVLAGQAVQVCVLRSSRKVPMSQASQFTPV